jgi:hypothetical protein
VHCLFGPIRFIKYVQKIFYIMHLDFVHYINWIMQLTICVEFCALKSRQGDHISRFQVFQIMFSSKKELESDMH